MALQTLDWSATQIGVLVVECRAVGCVDAQDDAVAALAQKWGLDREGSFRARHDIWDAVYVNRSSRFASQFRVWGEGAVDDPATGPSGRPT